MRCGRSTSCLGGPLLQKAYETAGSAGAAPLESRLQRGPRAPRGEEAVPEKVASEPGRRGRSQARGGMASPESGRGEHTPGGALADQRGCSSTPRSEGARVGTHPPSTRSGISGLLSVTVWREEETPTTAAASRALGLLPSAGVLSTR